MISSGFIEIHWWLVGEATLTSLPHNVQDNRAATSDCQFENARLRGSGALHCYVAVRLALIQGMIASVMPNKAYA